MTLVKPPFDGRNTVEPDAVLRAKIAKLYEPGVDIRQLQQFTEDEAVELDAVILEAVDEASFKLNDLIALVEYAKSGQIHDVLGYASWTAYIQARLEPLRLEQNPVEARQIAIELHRQGMSIRDAAQATGQSKSTVGRAVSQSGTPDVAEPVTTDRNGNTQTRKRQKPTTPKAVSFYSRLEKLTTHVERITASVAEFVSIVDDENRESCISELQQTREVLRAQLSVLDKIIDHSATPKA